MLNPPVIFLLGALVTGWLGFGVLAGTAARLTKFLCFVCLGGFAFTMYQNGAGW